MMERFIEKKIDGEFDILIIGGGITGAAVAYDAASRGFSVALVEKSDFGSATSSATSKLIHGGLRYLVNLELGLVRESLRERKTLENIAPNFVYPIANMVVTNRKNLKNNKWIIKMGMILYDILSYDKKFTWDKSKKIPMHSSISAKKVMSVEPNVKSENLSGAAVYYDCISIFPERLTLAFIKSAVKYGAKVANYAKVEGFLTEGGKVKGIRVRDLLKDKTVEISGRLTINCGGPWADIVLGLARRVSEDQKIRRSEGIHIITKKLINEHIVTSMTPAGKHFFLIPWRGHSLIGTTDKEYIGSPDEWRVTRESIEELIDDVNSSFGNRELLSYRDVKFAYGGLRPLVEDQTEDVYESSRKYEIYDNSTEGLDGLITVEGGKYTTSRNLAQNVMNMAAKKLGGKTRRTLTDKEYLSGCEIKDMKGFLEKMKRDNTDFSEKTVEFLSKNYGTEARAVIDIARGGKEYSEVVNEDGEIMAEVAYAVRNEMARTLRDILFRRTGIGTLGNPGDKILKKVASAAARELRWTPARMIREIASVKEVFKIPAGSGQKNKGKKNEK